MDSIRDEVCGHYRHRGSQLVDLRHDQDSTDLQKCIRHIIARTEERARIRGSGGAEGHVREHCNNGGEDIKIVVVGALGGRLDHELANLSLLYEYHRLRIVIVSDDSVAYVLPKGRNTILLVSAAIPRSNSCRWTNRQPVIYV